MADRPHRGAWLTFGFDEHLGRAARIAVDGMLDLMEREHGLDRSDALALASVVVDLRVTQVVNGARRPRRAARRRVRGDDEPRLPALARAAALANGYFAFATRPPASPCAGRTRASGSSPPPASPTGPRRSPTPRSTRRAGSRSSPSPRTSTTRTRSRSGTRQRTLQVGYVPAAVAPELAGDEQAVSLWRVEGGLRVLIAPADAWVGTPR